MWPDRRLIDLLGIEHPLIQAPMAGATTPALAAAAANGGALGSLGCAMLDEAGVRAEVQAVRTGSNGALNLNFFCHTPPEPDLARQAAWRARLADYYAEFGLDANADAPSVNRAPFNEAMCDLVLELAPKAASFHFGLPEERLVRRLKDQRIVILATATTVAEACWLEERGVDAVIAQGAEAGGHRGFFLSEFTSTLIGTMALVPQVADAVKVPVIATGGIADGRGIAAVFMLGAAGAQIGTAYLFTPEAKVSAIHRKALEGARDDATALTNVFSGRPARGLVNRIMREVGPISALAPAFPTAGAGLAPLKAAAEAKGSGEFSSLWAGQAASLGRNEGAAEKTARLAREALDLLGQA